MRELLLIMAVIFSMALSSCDNAYAGIRLGMSSSPVQDYVDEIGRLRTALLTDKAGMESVYLFIDIRTQARHKAEFMDLIFAPAENSEPPTLSQQIERFDKYVYRLNIYPDVMEVREILGDLAETKDMPGRKKQLEEKLKRAVDILNEARESSQTVMTDEEMRRLKEAADQVRIDAIAEILEQAMNRWNVGASVYCGMIIEVIQVE